MGDFKDKHGKTRVGKFLENLGEKAAPVAKIALEVAGGLTGIKQLEKVADMIKTNDHLDEHEKEIALELLEIDRQMYEAEIRDRESARRREVDMAGKTDWLMYVAGVTALATFVLMVIAVIFLDVGDNPLFNQLMGIIEGVALTIFAYYFGTSKSSNDKTKMLRR